MTKTQRQKLIALIDTVNKIVDNERDITKSPLKDLCFAAIDFQESINQEWNKDNLIDEIRENTHYIEI